ncbi:MAG: glycosyltransferase family 2 protein [Candidatus Marinimicrobia bacterium]|jgi:GT2 family glycosyltransferase|nr:glycosyltransferase family 2 protein [Candidatus Neomarinimicrobiota bacterium]MBT4360763.1 glycosyltransferase family 2 protein [Candidatus Neomarinimicrobiota bacterium]MBT4944667.1 glycosyltransferase family 2 protein [Candidatus Neomarinimicrobiota bacterium]MBT5268186.1 glycosyltransferase family 2 protein [Candidatus Neomarinimicrobiota bacterium]MBT6012196.1 glycosyltransferase family 2 protein [Candidatus Neomarinimicrobiota bacterium]
MPASQPGKTLADMEFPIQISILIVTYNSSSTIRVCLESVIKELQLLDGEVIVVDNQSTDDTVSILDELSTQNPILKVELNRTNRGFAVGNNQALEMAGGQHILILNPDTILQADILKNLLVELEKDAKMGVVAPQLQFPDGRIQKTCRRFPNHMDVIYNVFGLSVLFPENRRLNGWKMGDFDHKTRQEVDQPAGAALLVRGDLLRSLGGFDDNFPMFFNDVDLCKRIKDAGYTIWYLPEYAIQHLGGVSVKQVKMKMTISSHVSFFRYFEKHFTRMYQQPFNFIVGVLLYLSLIPRLLVLLLFKGQRTASRETL